MPLNDLNDLFIHDLRDVADAEIQLCESLSKLEATAHDPTLRTRLGDYGATCAANRTFVMDVFRLLGESHEGKPCAAIRALTEADDRLIAEQALPAVKDAALIGAVHRMNHYKIAAYGCLRAYADLLGRSDAERFAEIVGTEAKFDVSFQAIATSCNSKSLRPVVPEA